MVPVVGIVAIDPNGLRVELGTRPRVAFAVETTSRAKGAMDRESPHLTAVSPTAARPDAWPLQQRNTRKIPEQRGDCGQGIIGENLFTLRKSVKTKGFGDPVGFCSHIYSQSA